MKVLDLQCAQAHSFEGWFASEEEYVSQCARSLVQCPLCGDAQVHKKPSAPRLNLSTTQATAEPNRAAAWLELSRHILAHTQDVGDRFAQEARKMHYGETEERAIRGQASLEEARALVEEGIELVPLALPPSLKTTLQ